MGDSIPTILNLCPHPALALLCVSNSSPGDESKQMLHGETSTGSCPWC